MSRDPWLLASTEVDPARDDLVGGKAANLARLARAGQRVPDGYVLTTAAYRHARGELPEDLRQALLTHHERTLGDALVAVRSSAVGEDAAGASFAGLHDSFLFVRGPDELTDAVARVWASAYSPRALAYRRARGLPTGDVAIAVVVQRMVEARASGVLFTVNPNTGDVYEMVASALWGAGEGLVSAGLDADTFTIDKETFPDPAAVRAEVTEKCERLVFDRDAGRGLRREPVPEELRARPSLDDAEVVELAHRGLEIERAFGRPQDVEFSVDDAGELWILQARPVTTVEEYGPAAGHPLLWDNSNIIESYSGVTSPMTFSFIRRAYAIVYHCFAEVMGIRPEVVRANRWTFENMLGLFRGQVYYNLHNWYRLVRLFPGFEYNRAFMESMMGVRESAELGDEEAPGWRRRYFVELPALARLVGRSLANFARIRTLVGRFEADFRRLYGRWSALDFDAMAPHELMALYHEMEDELLWNWKAPIVNDFFVMIFYGTLRKLSESWCGDAAGTLQNDLLCGEGGIESTEPTKMLLGIAAEARRDEAMRRHLLERSPDELARELAAGGGPEALHARVRRYLELYGFRCVDELKLEVPSLRDRPQFVYQVLRNYLAGDEAALDPEAATARERRVREEAEARAFAALSWPKRLVFRRVLAAARLGVKNRENLRFARTRIYGLLRDLLRAVGRAFAREGILDEAGEVFYLTLDEVWDYVKGTAVTTDLRGLAALRRREFETFRSDREAMPDDRFETFGMAYHRNRFKARPRPAAAADGELRGVGCCPGVVTGPVKVLRSPSDGAELAGEILVAERTDPGWVPLYPSASGLLIERGSILSHSAIVAREMGLPTIVGIPGLTDRLETGQRVTMDGATGAVEVVGQPPG